jgi:protein arginine kinase activator
MGLTSEKQILDLEKLFGLLEDRRPEESEPPRVCDQCGMSYQSFRRGGRLGCSHDYQEFAELLVPLLRRVHGNERHVGKTPKRIGRDLARRRYISQLRSDMKAAVAREDYEQAARLRDEIKEIETEEASHEAR